MLTSKLGYSTTQS